jgi:hypothetical protein
LGEYFSAWFIFRLLKNFLKIISKIFFYTFRSVVMVSFYFDKKRPLANGIISIIEIFGFYSYVICF